MKITSIDVYTVALPFARPERWAAGARQGCANVLVKLVTDDGLVGWGETSGGSGGPVSVVRAAVDSCTPFVLGMSPFDVEQLRGRIFRLGRWRNLYRLGHLAVAAYEMAFYDLMGKSCQVPVHALLGGAVRDRISIYGYVVEDEPAAMAEEAGRLVASGFEILYMKVGWSSDRDVETLRLVRSRIGDQPRIRVDANEAWTVAQAVRSIRALAPFGLEFVEQPVPALDVEGLRRVREASDVPIAANQGLWSSEEIVQIIRQRAADIVVTGPLWLGGLLPLKKAAAIASAAGLEFCRHAPPEAGIATAAGLHVLATLPELMDGNQIYLGQVLMEDVVVGGPPAFEHGCLRVPEGPGLGVEVDEERVLALAEMFEQRGDFLQYDEEIAGG